MSIIANCQLAKGALTLALSTLLLTGCGQNPGEREYHNALRQLERGNLEQARDLFEKSINKRPGRNINAYAYHHLGVLAWLMDEPQNAATYFESSRRLHPQLFEPVYSLAVLAWESGDLIRARSLFGQASQLHPTDPRPLEYLAQTYPVDTGFAERRRMLMEALARAPQSPRILTSLALVELQHAQPNRERAVDLLMQALESNPDYPPALFNLGMASIDDPDRQADALAYFQQFLSMPGNDAQRQRAEQAIARLRGEPTAPPPVELAVPTEAVRPPPPPPPPTWAQELEAAERLAAAGDLQGAVSLCLRVAARAAQQQPELQGRALEKATRLAPQSGTAQLALARYQAARSMNVEAAASYRRATRAAPGWAHAWMELAEIALGLKEYDEALHAIQQAVSLDASAAEGQWMLAEILNETGSRRRAAEEFRIFQQRFPDDPRADQAGQRANQLQPAGPAPQQLAIAALQRGISAQQQGDRRSALAAYQQAIELDPSLEVAHYNRGLILLEQGDLQRATEAFRQSVELEPGKTASRYNLALAQYQSGRIDPARAELERVIGMDPAFAPAHLLLGIIYAAEPTGTVRARHHYRQFVNLSPNDPSTPAVREWLRQN